jgi:hypothetical protein
MGIGIAIDIVYNFFRLHISQRHNDRLLHGKVNHKKKGRSLSAQSVHPINTI